MGKEKEEPISDEELESMMKKYESSYKDIQKKILEIEQVGGVSMDQVREYLNDPANFTPDVWEVMQEEREKEEETLKKLETISAEEKKKQVKKKKRRKFLGGRNKWIQMD